MHRGSITFCRIGSPLICCILLAALIIPLGCSDDPTTPQINSNIILVWGNCGDGQCDIPPRNADFVAVAGGSNHSLGLKSNGVIVAWGLNGDDGRIEVPEPNSGFVAIASGEVHSLGLKSDGTIVGWGWNYLGQCNPPEPNADFVAIAAGSHHSLAIR